MKSFKILTKEEITQVKKILAELLHSNDISDIFRERVLIKIMGRKDEVYSVLPTDIQLFEHIYSDPKIKNFQIMHARMKIGFFIQARFYIGIEFLSFLAPLSRRKIYLNNQDTQQFIYGKNIEITSKFLKNQVIGVEENRTVIVFSVADIPLGYAKINSHENKKWLQNVIDIGIYLRSEKTAF